LVFAAVDLAALNPDETRLAPVINCLRRRFTDQLSVSSQDPSDPAYLERWQELQPEIDSMLKGMIGINAFHQFDLAARASWQKRPAETP